MPGADPLLKTRTKGVGPVGQLPVSKEQLREAPSGDLFGLTQNAGMGWRASEIGRDPYLIISTAGGLRHPDGSPIALGYHTGHWEIDRLVKIAAETFSAEGALPFAAACSDPCDGRSQGTTGMFDSLPYRNDAATTMRRLIRSLPRRKGVLGIATCDKGLPATLLALAGSGDLPGVIVPGGVTLPAEGGEDAGKVQTIGARFAQGAISYDYAVDMGCKACGSPGGGCQFLGTAATSQVVSEAMGLSLPHSALCPSGEPVWKDLAKRSAIALLRLSEAGITVSDILTQKAIDNAMIVHAAFGGSTNLLLHISAIAHTAGLRTPVVEDWTRVNRSTPRLVDALPNGPRNHPTVQVFMAGGVPEVMLHLREMGLLHLDALTSTGQSLGENLAWWEKSDARSQALERLRELDKVDPEEVIFGPAYAREKGYTSALVFPTGNIAPDGSVIKATSIDPTMVDQENCFHHEGKARVFASESAAIKAIKSKGKDAINKGDVIVLIGCGPTGTGMEETYQLTSALKHLSWGKHVPVLTDARFSGVSTGACIGHIGPEALAGGPIGKLRDGDRIEIHIDRNELTGSINFLGTDEGDPLSASDAADVLQKRETHSSVSPHPQLPDDTRLWAALQDVSGGTWNGCVYDVDKIIETLEAGKKAIAESREPQEDS
ncbi:YjhG/YagF family D-xylonate dehydratase [Pelagicoccus mobilis]|uniref:YjhG/YagF family D-xylonate dehydratase n=1 Tax=Pelagicoccus mobilis TaxID=415221 RepID=A0A934S2X1_9BACT|nr:YjhG/YagF family D-xylonate dehydratase [Pelagicoccus mobilis]